MEKRRIDWPVTLFLLINPLAAIAGTVYVVVAESFSNWLWLVALVFAALTNLSVTAGYHRLYAHRSYEAHPLAQWILLLIGASAFQGSALKWCSDHRRHHAEVDSPDDPYSINKGFWYAHIGWLFRKESVDMPIKAVDLEKNHRVFFQHKYYISLSIAMGFLLPTLIGLWMGSALAGLFIGGALRIFLTQQSTFFVNSLCHVFGRQTYTREVSARDSLFVAILTHGEGYHNFHHKFQVDFRNGIRWYHWDPTKWTILMLKWSGLASKLRTISNTEILKARLQVEAQRLSLSGFSSEKIEQMKEKILEAQTRLRSMQEDYREFKRQAREAGQARVRALRLELALAKLDLRSALEQWQLSLQLAPVRVEWRR